MFNRFFLGRYGMDRFGRTLLVGGLILSVLSLFLARAPIAYYVVRGVSWGLLIYAIFRMLSRNIAARQAELSNYMVLESKVRGRWWSAKTKWGNRENTRRERKQYKYLACPQCAQKLRVPRGKGTIRITCSKCGNKFNAKS